MSIWFQLRVNLFPWLHIYLCWNPTHAFFLLLLSFSFRGGGDTFQFEAFFLLLLSAKQRMLRGINLPQSKLDLSPPFLMDKEKERRLLMDSLEQIMNNTICCKNNFSPSKNVMTFCRISKSFLFILLGRNFHFADRKWNFNIWLKFKFQINPKQQLCDWSNNFISSRDGNVYLRNSSRWWWSDQNTSASQPVSQPADDNTRFWQCQRTNQHDLQDELKLSLHLY